MKSLEGAGSRTSKRWCLPLAPEMAPALWPVNSYRPSLLELRRSWGGRLGGYHRGRQSISRALWGSRLLEQACSFEPKQIIPARKMGAAPRRGGDPRWQGLKSPSHPKCACHVFSLCMHGHPATAGIFLIRCQCSGGAILRARPGSTLVHQHWDNAAASGLGAGCAVNIPPEVNSPQPGEVGRLRHFVW